MSELVAREIPLDLVVRNADQPRQHFSTDSIRELANSIVERGRLLQPITVRPVNGMFEIVMGERRTRAMKSLGRQSIPAYVVDMSVRERDLQAIVENLQREDISPLEQGLAFKRLLDQGMTVEELAKSVGVSTFRVEDDVRLLQLRPQYMDLYRKGHINTNAARCMAVLDPHSQDRLFARIKAGDVKGWNHMKALRDQLLAEQAQSGMFSDAEMGKASDEDDEKLSRLEKKIESIAAMASAGFDSDNAIEIAKKVAPHRAKDMADKLDLIQRTLVMLSKDLRRAAAQVELAA